MKIVGRPAYNDQQYLVWCETLEPFLKQGNTLHYSIERAGLITFKDSIYRKFKLGDWFCEKITYFQGYPSELLNEVLARYMFNLHNKVINGGRITSSDVKMFKIAIDHLPGCELFFLQRKSKRKSTRSKAVLLEKVIKSLEAWINY